MKGTTVVWAFVGLCVVVALAAVIYGAFVQSNNQRDRCEQLGGVYIGRGEKCVVGIEGWTP